MPASQPAQKTAVPETVQTTSKPSEKPREEFSFFGIRLSRSKPIEQVSGGGDKNNAAQAEKKSSAFINSVPANYHLLKQPPTAEAVTEVPLYRPRARRKNSFPQQASLPVSARSTKGAPVSVALTRQTQPAEPVNSSVEPETTHNYESRLFPRNAPSVFSFLYSLRGGSETVRTSTHAPQAAQAAVIQATKTPARPSTQTARAVASSDSPIGKRVSHPIKPPRRTQPPVAPLTHPHISPTNSICRRPEAAQYIRHGGLKLHLCTEVNSDIKAQENFTKIRNGWVKQAKALEDLMWTVGSKKIHDRRVGKYFIDAKTQPKQCDVVIRTADGQTVYAHSLVLAAHSKAFEKRLLSMNPGTGVPTIYRLHLTDKVSGVMVVKAVDWMYKGYTRIPAPLLPELTRVARYFHIVPLVVECLSRKLIIDAAHELAEKEIQSLTDSSDGESDSKAASRSAGSVKEDAAPHKIPQMPPVRLPTDMPASVRPSARTVPTSWSVMVAAGDGPDVVGSARGKSHPATRASKASSAVATVDRDPVTSARQTGHQELHDDDFTDLEPQGDHRAEEAAKDVPLSIMTMTITQLQELLSDDSLEIQSELEVLDAAMTWVAAAPIQREIYIHQLLSCVRFYHLSNDELKHCFRLHPTYFKLPLFRNMLGSAFRAKALITAHQPFPINFTVLPNRCRGDNKKNPLSYLISRGLAVHLTVSHTSPSLIYLTY